MAAKHDAVINELNFKIDKLIKLYTSSLEQNRRLEKQLSELQSELEQLKGENKELNEKLKQPEWRAQFQEEMEVMKQKCESTNWCGRLINVLLF